MSIEEPFPHPLYKYCKESEADALAYAFINKSEMIKFPFKFSSSSPFRNSSQRTIYRFMSK